MADLDDILDHIFTQLRKLAPEDVEVERDTDLVGKLGLDSTTVIDLVLELEDEYDVAIPLNALTDIRTPEELARLVHGLVEEE